MAPAHILMLAAFALCALIAIAGALGMATTMSMFRSGIFLMASFIGVAGLFILLAADLMGLLQIMMYIGGMLVMILFMVLFMHDPGGAMMAAMDDMLAPIERFFSRGLQQERDDDCSSQHGGMQDTREHEHTPRADAMQHEDMAYGGQGQHGMQHDKMPHEDMQMGGMQMDDMDMSMVTPVRNHAAWLAVVLGTGLSVLILLRPVWRISVTHPDPRAAELVGKLLMGKYMVAFESAGFLILIGIFGAVLLAHVKSGPDKGKADALVAWNEPPRPVEPDTLEPRQPAPPEQPFRAPGGHAEHSDQGDRPK